MGNKETTSTAPLQSWGGDVNTNVAGRQGSPALSRWRQAALKGGRVLPGVGAQGSYPNRAWEFQGGDWWNLSQPPLDLFHGPTRMFGNQRFVHRCRARCKAGKMFSFPTFPSATQTFRNRPRRLVRSIGVPANWALNPASSSLKQLDQVRRGKVGSGVGLHQISLAGKAIPRAHGEAIVAAVDAIADERAEFQRDLSL